MPARFHDHFSTQATDYARYRPRYPAALFDWLAALAPARSLAWDVATGSGQAASALAERFDRVVATDPSAAQLRSALRRDGVEYRCERAEASTLASDSADLVTVAQALHWFEHPAFFAECERVLRPGGVFAAWGYDDIAADPPIERLVRRFSDETVGAFWPPERRWLSAGYAGLHPPFDIVEAPRFRLEVDWTLDDLCGYVSTWSSVAGWRAAHGDDPLPLLREPLARAWGDPATHRRIAWPMPLLVGKKRG